MIMLVNMFLVKAHFYSSIIYKQSTGINQIYFTLRD